MARRRWGLALGVVVGALTALSAQVARADAIDGNWCSAEGKRMLIEPRDHDARGHADTGQL